MEEIKLDSEELVKANSNISKSSLRDEYICIKGDMKIIKRGFR